MSTAIRTEQTVPYTSPSSFELRNLTGGGGVDSCVIALPGPHGPKTQLVSSTINNHESRWLGLNQLNQIKQLVLGCRNVFVFQLEKTCIKTVISYHSGSLGLLFFVCVISSLFNISACQAPWAPQDHLSSLNLMINLMQSICRKSRNVMRKKDRSVSATTEMHSTSKLPIQTIMGDLPKIHGLIQH